MIMPNESYILVGVILAASLPIASLKPEISASLQSVTITIPSNYVYLMDPSTGKLGSS